MEKHGTALLLSTAVIVAAGLSFGCAKPDSKYEKRQHSKSEVIERNKDIPLYFGQVDSYEKQRERNKFLLELKRQTEIENAAFEYKSQQNHSCGGGITVQVLKKERNKITFIEDLVDTGAARKLVKDVTAIEVGYKPLSKDFVPVTGTKFDGDKNLCLQVRFKTGDGPILVFRDRDCCSALRANRTIEYKDKILEEWLDDSDVPCKLLPADYVADPKALVGKFSKGRIPEGAVITKDAVADSI